MLGEIYTNDVNLYVHSIYEFSTTCAGSINNVLPFKSVELAQSYNFMSFAILTKICINPIWAGGGGVK